MNITQITQRYLREHPSILECLNRGLINYSALAREICARHKITAVEAVAMACRRFPKDEVPHVQRERRIASLTKKAKLVLRTKMIVAAIEKPGAYQRALSLQQIIFKERGDFKLVDGEENLNVITNSDYLATLQRTFGNSIKNIYKNTVQVTMVFPQQLSTTIGVGAYVHRVLADRSINLICVTSSWDDVMFVIEEKDVATAMDALNRER